MLVVLFNLAAHVQLESAVGGVDYLDAGERLDRSDDLTPVFAVGCVYDDVAHAARRVDLDRVDRAHRAAGFADRARDRAEQRPVGVVELDPDGESVLGAGGDVHGQGLLVDRGQAILLCAPSRASLS